MKEAVKLVLLGPSLIVLSVLSCFSEGLHRAVQNCRILPLEPAAP